VDDIVVLFPRAEVSQPTEMEPDIHVAQAATGITVTPGSPETHVRTCDAVSAVEHAVTMHFLEGDRHHTHIHAAAALTERGAVLATGRSGAGKSTLAFMWAKTGIPIFGDDIIPLDPNGLAHTFPRLLKVDRDLLRESGGLPERTLAWHPEADEVWVDPRPSAGWAVGAARVVVVADICYRPGAELRIEEMAGGEGLRLLLNSVHQTGVSREQSLDRLIRVTEGSRVCRVEFGDAARATEGLLRMAADSPYC